jgi:N-methylhydantoinase A
MTFEIAVDVGGTFTDFVLNEDGVLTAYKSSSTPGNIATGILQGLEMIAGRRGETLGTILSRCGSFACGTTVATNAILEGKAAKTALLCTEGFRETLSIRDGGKADTYNIYLDFPLPYIPRHLTFGVRERINAEGGVEAPLDQAQVLPILAQLKDWKVEAVAVALLWSIANPAHEQRLGEMIEAALPGIPYSLSHRVSPTLREYRRTSATALDASLKPIVRRGVGEVEGRLRDAGFAGVLTFVTSNGGRTSPAEVLEKPVYLCLSGPSAAPMAGCNLARQAGVAHGNVLTIDMGGTSFEVSIATDWQVPMHREGVIGGHMFGVPSVDVRTIGAGGGSIARVDAGGFIHVGPASAGAFPGPACYGRGGTLPTVTDANLVRGLLEPSRFADGQMELSRGKAEAAVRDHVATPMKIDLRAAAALISTTVEQNMVAAIEDITIRRGIDPREFVLVSGGSAAGLHVVAIARELGIRQVLVSPLAGVLSAFGVATGDIRFNFARSLFTSTANFDYAGVARVLGELEAEGMAYLDRMQVPADRRALAYTTEARYAGQAWQLTLPLAVSHIADSATLADVVEAFHQLHERLYTVRAPLDPVEFTEWNLVAIGRFESDATPAPRQGVVSGPAASASASRTVFLPDHGGEVEISVLVAANLTPGQVVRGPCLVQDRLSVTLVPQQSEARQTPDGSLLIDLL